MEFDRDVAVVGGGVAGPAAGVFAARADLDTLVLDRGTSSIRQCAHLGNYLGFPGGIRPDRFCDLAHAHLRECGATVRERHVEAVRRIGGPTALVDDERADNEPPDDEPPDGEPAGFRVETDDGALTARRVVAATKYDAAYLAPLDDGDLLVGDAPGEADGSADAGRDVDPDAVDADGRTAIPGLYVAGPLGGTPDQALISAGHGARVGRALAIDVLEDRGHWPAAAELYHDWRTPTEAYEEGWAERFRERFVSEAPADVDPDRARRVAGEIVERERDHSLTGAAVERRRERGWRALLAEVPDDAIRAYVEAEMG